jgi:hypothetical protein
LERATSLAQRDSLDETVTSESSPASSFSTENPGGKSANASRALASCAAVRAGLAAGVVGGVALAVVAADGVVLADVDAGAGEGVAEPVVDPPEQALRARITTAAQLAVWKDLVTGISWCAGMGRALATRLPGTRTTNLSVDRRAIRPGTSTVARSRDAGIAGTGYIGPAASALRR